MALIEQHTNSQILFYSHLKKKKIIIIYFIFFYFIFFGDNRLMTFVIDNHNYMSKRPIIDIIDHRYITNLY